MVFEVLHRRLSYEVLTACGETRVLTAHGVPEACSDLLCCSLRGLAPSCGRVLQLACLLFILTCSRLGESSHPFASLKGGTKAPGAH